MESLTLKTRQPVDEDIECWDDDGDLQGIDNFQFRNTSTTTIGSANASFHRESISSRMSIKSDGDSVAGDNDWQVLLPTDDEASTNDAIASAKTAGIPIPANVPTSALLGGTIKRLGGRKIKKAFDDWDEDLELPKPGAEGLTLKMNKPQDFPDTLRQFSGDFSMPTSPSPSKPGMTFMERMESARKEKPVLPALDKFRDDEDDDFFGDVPTIKVAKNRSAPKHLEPPQPRTKPTKDVENIEEDLEFPANGEPLRLSVRKEAPKTPASQLDDIDMEWAEGSLGTRFGGTRRDGRSNPGSSMSAFSPSTSSCFTAESEDEGLEGLVLPEGPLKFDEVLKKRLEDVSPEAVPPHQEKSAEKPALPKDDFFTGIELGDGDVFDSGKLTLNRNIKHKATRQTSPKRPATTLTFTNKASPGHTKIPQLQKNERTRTRLEPVSESGGPVSSRSTRPQSRMSGHAPHSSLSNIPTPSTPSSHSAAPATPSRRGLTNKPSQEGLRGAPPSNPAQYLKAKRSMPAINSSPARNQTSYQRPPSRGDYGPRQSQPPRPKTPTDRAESSLANARKPPIPFLPAGTSSAQSHHISIKSSRHAHRPGSSDSNENQPLNRPLSRLSNAHYRPSTPTGRRDVAPESLTREAASKRTVTKPIRRRAFGDGSELEVFDDLPTSATTESKFVRQPIARGAPKSVQMRSKLGLSNLHSTASANIEPPPSTPATPFSPPKQDFTPRFARDTNASRMAREQRIGSVSATLHAAPNLPTVRESGPLSTLSTNFRTQVSSKSTASPSVARVKRGKGPPQKPQLIKQIGDAGSNPKTLKGMSWNPTLFRWEGNENALAPFDTPVPPPQQSPKATGRGGKPAPALIANVGATKGVQVVSGMVFDPQRMCWLKMGPSHQTGGYSSNPRSPDTIDEDDDPFAGLDDLEDSKDRKSLAGLGVDDSGTSSKALADEEWPVGEEFDVGPEFVKRQRTEEEKWRRKVEGWVGKGTRGRGGDEWKWALRGHVEKLTVL
ncbi:MAG: hypothetical protein Q9169_004254 [Polycauliona sp. 2 TL-2023]